AEVEALLGSAAALQRVDGTAGRALELALEALALAREAGYGLLEARALTCVAALHLDARRLGQAAEVAGQALVLHRRSGHRLGEARAHLVLGHALDRTEGTAAALPEWQRALELLTEL